MRTSALLLVALAACAPSEDADVVFRSTTITVNTVTDLALSSNAPPCECETSVPDACSLRAAVQTANDCEGHDVIVLGVSGTYTLSLGAPDDDDAVSGDLDIFDSVTISAQVNPPVSASISGDFNDRVFDIHKSAESVTLSGLKVMEGELYPPNFALGASNGGCIRAREIELRLIKVIVGGDTGQGCLGNQGGGLYAEDAGVTISSSIFADNEAAAWVMGMAVVDGFGGGFHARDTRLVVESTHVLSNQASGRGGGVALLGKAPPATLTDLTIEGNEGVSSGGGGYMFAPFQMTDSAVVNNLVTDASAAGGGGLHVGPLFDGGSVVRTTLFDGNTAPIGGGISLEGALDVVESDIRINKATGGLIASEGGGIYGGKDSFLKLDRSSVQRNSAELGAGLSTRGEIRGSNSTIALNEAQIDGGGVYGRKGSFTELLHCTVRENNALTGAGGGMWIHASADASLDRTALAANGAPLGPPECTGPVGTPTVVVSDPSSCVAPSSAIIAATVFGWGPLTYSGNPTATYEISPPNSALSAASPCGVGIDQWGKGREDTCDVGAYEEI